MDFRLARKLVSDLAKNNRLVYRPSQAAAILMTVLLYIIFAISDMLRGSSFLGARSISRLMQVLAFVFVGISVFIFFYINSFLAKRRQASYGLYAVLGLDKKDLGKLYALDSFRFFSKSAVLGLLLGMLASRLAYTLILKLLKGSVVFSFKLSTSAVISVGVVLLAIFLVLLAYNFATIKKSEIVDLLVAEESGEKEPKASIILSLLAVVTLAYAYHIANNFDGIFGALNNFLIAVPLVVLGTYLLFIGLAVFVLKALKRNKSLYYKPRHFFNISNLIFRMKANAGSLATISVLFTCAFLTFSVTATLYFGSAATVDSMAPRAMNFEQRLSIEVEDDKPSLKALVTGQPSLQELPQLNRKLAGKRGLEVSQELVRVSYLKDPNDSSSWAEIDDTVPAKAGNSYEVSYLYAFDLDLSPEDQEDYSMGLFDMQKESDLRKVSSRDGISVSYQWLSYNSRAEMEDAMLFAFGTLFFIGIYFIIFFLITSSLILYFKQLNQAYSDRWAFYTLQELGLDRTGVKAMINTQVLITFFLPLAFAIVNVFASYKILWALLEALTNKSYNQSYFGKMSLISVLILGGFYFLVYLWTTKIYYRIVERKVS
ncbi:MAG: hypothetical protein Q4E09_05820 [Eubacteriales bacterium]|nr:hypothetical protein [Eubacteriales bacterium]